MDPNNQQPGQTFGSMSQPPSMPTSTPPPSYQQQNPQKDNKKTKKLMIIIGVLTAVFILFLVIFLIVGSGKKKPAIAPQQENKVESIVKEPTAIEIENVNNSISDDITNLSTDGDFPADNLSDEKLEL